MSCFAIVGETDSTADLTQHKTPVVRKKLDEIERNITAERRVGSYDNTVILPEKKKIPVCRELKKIMENMHINAVCRKISSHKTPNLKV